MKFKTVDEWFENFLWKGIEKQLQILEEGGYLAYNIADPHNRNSIKKITKEDRAGASSGSSARLSLSLVEKLNLRLRERDDLTYVGWIPLHFLGNPPFVEPVWVWRKKRKSLENKKIIFKYAASPGYCSQNWVNADESSHSGQAPSRKRKRDSLDQENGTGESKPPGVNSTIQPTAASSSQ